MSIDSAALISRGRESAPNSLPPMMVSRLVAYPAAPLRAYTCGLSCRRRTVVPCPSKNGTRRPLFSHDGYRLNRFDFYDGTNESLLSTSFSTLLDVRHSARRCWLQEERLGKPVLELAARWTTGSAGVVVRQRRRRITSLYPHFCLRLLFRHRGRQHCSRQTRLHLLITFRRARTAGAQRQILRGRRGIRRARKTPYPPRQSQLSERRRLSTHVFDGSRASIAVIASVLLPCALAAIAAQCRSLMWHGPAFLAACRTAGACHVDGRTPMNAPSRSPARIPDETGGFCSQLM